MSILFALPLVLLVVGVFFGIASGMRAVLTWITWMVFITICVCATLYKGHPMFALVIDSIGFAFSFLVAAFVGFAQSRVNPNAPAVKIADAYGRLSPNEKETLGRLAGHAVRFGAAYAADRVRNSHPKTSDFLSRLSRS